MKLSFPKLKTLYLGYVLVLLPIACFRLYAQSDIEWDRKLTKRQVLSDLDTLYSKIIHKHVNPFWKISTREYNRNFNRIRSEVVSMKAQELTAESAMVIFQRLLSFTGDIHSMVWQIRGNRNCALFPIYLKRFEKDNGEEYRVMAADSANADLLGCTIEKIGRKSIQQVIKELGRVFPEKSLHSYPYLTRVALKNAVLLHGLGIIENRGEANYEFKSSGGSTFRKKVASYYPKGMATLKLLYFDDSLKQVPLTSQFRDLYHWFQYLPEKRAVYFRYSAVANNDNEPTAPFAARLFRFVDSVQADRLIIDLRDNTGGNSFLNVHFLAGIARSSNLNHDDKLFCLVNSLTFSAAINFLQQLDARTPAIIIGQPPADPPNFCSDVSLDTLPVSRLPVALSTLELLNSFEYDARRIYEPEIRMKDFSWREYVSSIDRMLDTALTLNSVESLDSKSSTALDPFVGKYVYNSVKPAYLLKNGHTYYFHVPGEIYTQLSPRSKILFATQIKDLQIGIGKSGVITMFHTKGTRANSLRKASGDIHTLFEAIQQDSMNLGQEILRRLKQNERQLLSLSDVNMCLEAYRQAWIAKDSLAAYRFLQINQVINPEGTFGSYTKKLMGQTLPRLQSER